MLPESGKIDWKVEFPELDKIRNYRNRYFGHPTEGKSKNSFHVGSLQPTSDSLEKIELLKMELYNGVENAMFIEEVNVIECIKEQIDIFYKVMMDMITQLQQKLADSAKANP